MPPNNPNLKRGPPCRRGIQVYMRVPYLPHLNNVVSRRMYNFFFFLCMHFPDYLR